MKEGGAEKGSCRSRVGGSNNYQFPYCEWNFSPYFWRNNMNMKTIYYQKNEGSSDSLSILTDTINVHVNSEMYWYEEGDGETYDDSTFFVTNAESFLAAIAEARTGKDVKITGRHDRELLSFRNFTIDITNGGKGNSWASHPINFDPLFLDTFSIIENSELRKREARDIFISPAEIALLDILRKNPDLLHNFSAREFEVVASIMLTNMGFSKVRLSRFVTDTGYDIFAIYFVGDSEYSVVIEVKKYNQQNVGLEIVDRLNGVRDRMGADKGIVITTSSFSSDSRRLYRYNNSKIALVDFEKLQDILTSSSMQWKMTPSGLWTLPSTNCPE